MEGNILWPLDPLVVKTAAFHRSLYHKKHTFRFREVKKWEESMKVRNYLSRTPRYMVI